MTHSEARSAAHALFDRDEVREVLETTFYRDESSTGAVRAPLARFDAKKGRKKAPRAKAPAKPKPEHYEVICISLYKEDLAALDAKVEALKASGHRRMTRSALIRYALDRLAVEDVPRPVL